jgi:hypothetical protein
MGENGFRGMRAKSVKFDCSPEHSLQFRKILRPVELEKQRQRALAQQAMQFKSSRRDSQCRHGFRNENIRRAALNDFRGIWLRTGRGVGGALLR